ncbi:MAG: GGDEF domain-containing protein [Lachnospiraceae bacterium]|nr:GGDEF domain-containing protein [Lachnospiraceae bacterium]
MVNLYMYVLTLISNIFAGLLAFRSNHVNRYKNNFYMLSITFNTLILASELLSEFAEMYDWRMVNILTNVVTYMLCPSVTYCLFMMNAKKWGLKEKLMMIPGIIVAIGTLTTQWTGFVFYVDENNVYTRGSLFTWTLVISGAYFFCVVFTSYREYRDADLQEKLYLLGIFLVAAAGVIIQIADTTIRSMWPTVAITLLLYYVFTLEMSAKYDFLTGVRNRNAYDQKREKLHNNRSYGLVVFDINGLKTINDQLGHQQGDQLISESARILVDTFWGYGKIYRIGGDEFALVFEKCDRETIDTRIGVMESRIAKENQNRTDWKISISYGVEIHKSDDEKTYEEVFENADNKMYEMKQNYYKEKAGK